MTHARRASAGRRHLHQSVASAAQSLVKMGMEQAKQACWRQASNGMEAQS